jgi:hypothetical protein
MHIGSFILLRVVFPSNTAKVVMDLLGQKFLNKVKTLLVESGIVHKSITTQNLQVNAVVECAHKTIHRVICTQNLKKRDDLPDGSWTGVLIQVHLVCALPSI